MKLLDLYCGAGGAAEGYRRAGFTDIVGVDIRDQPRYPFWFWQGDALEYLARYGREFDAIHASPPCQQYSRTRKILEGKGLPNKHPDLIAPTREALRACGRPYIIENVPGAPLLDPVVLCGTQFGLRVYRHRLFEASIPLLSPPHTAHRGSTGSHRGYSTGHPFVTVGGHNFNYAEGAAAMGMLGVYAGKVTLLGTKATPYAAGSGRTHYRPEETTLQAGREALGACWMTRDELCQAIPPAYTEYLGRQLLAYLQQQAAA